VKLSIVTTRLFILTFVAWAVLVFRRPHSGQALHGTILGTITDSSHAVVGGVRVTVTEAENQLPPLESSNGKRLFRLLEPRSGYIRIEVEHPGFRKGGSNGHRPHTEHHNSRGRRIDPGRGNGTVDVTAGAALLQTDRADTGGKIEGAQLADAHASQPQLPALLMLVPGVQKSYGRTRRFQFPGASAVGRERLDQRNNYLIEGIDNNVENLTGIIPPPDAIATVDVSTTNYDPEFGRRVAR